MKVVRLNRAAAAVGTTIVLGVLCGLLLWFGGVPLSAREKQLILEQQIEREQVLIRNTKHQRNKLNKGIVVHEAVDVKTDPQPEVEVKSNTLAPSPFPIVECETTQGSLTIEVRNDWGPIGAERFLQQVEAGFFTQNLFYRVPPRSHPIAQFGFSPSIKLRKEFEKQFKDDPPTWQRLPIETGMLAFAGGGVNTRSCHYWFAIEGKSYMGHDAWETPIGRVTKGLDVLKRITVTEGKVNLNSIFNDASITKNNFPGDYLHDKTIDWFKYCNIVSDPWTSRKHYEPKPSICPTSKDCEYSKPIKSEFLPGCAAECKGFNTLADAQVGCDAIETCGGITQTGATYYELRQGLSGSYPGRKDETSWLKSGPLVIVKT